MGSYNGGEGEGIHVYQMDASTGRLTQTGAVGGVRNPSFLAIHPDGGHLYSVSEVAEADGGSGGGVAAFAIDPASGDITLLNQQSSGGKGPCHLSVEQTGRHVLVANYSSGSVAMLPIQADGSLGEATGFVQHEGSSVNKRRQEGPHAHSITVGPDNRCAFAADLGIDKVLIYRIDLGTGELKPNEPASAEVSAGQGPRHFAFHPNRQFAYVINEMGNTVTAFTHDESTSALTEIQMISTLPEGYGETSHCADIHISGSGEVLYGSNRGHDSIAIFGIDADTGMLAMRDLVPTKGENPRNFAIDPTGKWLLAANQDTDNVVVFGIDQQTGGLVETGVEVSVPKPVCVKLIEA